MLDLFRKIQSSFFMKKYALIFIPYSKYGAADGVEAFPKFYNPFRMRDFWYFCLDEYKYKTYQELF